MPECEALRRRMTSRGEALLHRAFEPGAESDSNPKVPSTSRTPPCEDPLRTCVGVIVLKTVVPGALPK
eukprot:scaffold7381_cov310-Pinguiococcus_pyrenoidosus.AAC.8